METKKQKICLIRVAKNICYFLIPLLFVFLISSIISVVYAYEIGMAKEGENYYLTTQFAENYFSSINNNFNQIVNAEIDQEQAISEENSYMNEYYEIPLTEINGKKMNIVYQQNTNNFMYLIIDYKNNVIYVSGDDNVSYHMTIESLKQEICSNEQYWIYDKGKIDTTIEKLSEEKIKNTNLYQENLQKGDYTIYTAVRDKLPYYDSYLGEYIVYSIAKHQYDTAIYTIPISIILLIIMIPIILIGIGKTKDREGIHLTWFDKLPIEVAISLIGIVTLGICIITFGIGTNIAAIVSIVCIAIGIIALYIECILFFETIVKRLKTHTFIKTTFAYWIYRKMKFIFDNMKISLRVGIMFVGFIAANWIIVAIFDGMSFITFIFLMALYAFSFIYVLKRTVWNEKIYGAIEQIYQGNTNIRLNEQEYQGDLKKVATQVNDIAGGFSNAVEEKLKSERLKTELITNVSHDIKTPLTSIINYVDLLKKEDITTEKAAEYLAILDNKSQRLKKLTEDLVEASKASSGNLKINMEKLEVNELIKQVSAEFEDKFKAHGLIEISAFTKQPVYIKADSRYMYRVLENMYSNVSKYAMENTRVYIDIIEHGNNVIIQIKNISREKLNITTDELMQRFVRGDTSRNTEGSGLGLSIANSLTELQGGQFHIYLDGDLFKVTIGFKKVL